MAGELAALRSAGHEVGEWKDSEAPPFHARRCQAGTIDKIDAQLCEYPSADALPLGRSAGDAWIGQAATGVVLQREQVLLMLADRNRVDPQGKAIAKISRSFRRQPAKK